MVLYIRVVDGEVESVGPLPERARRLDTGQIVDPRQWLKATGYHNVETATVDDLPPDLTAEQREAIIATVVAARNRQDGRGDLAAKVHAITSIARDKNWDWIDQFCHGLVAAFPFVQEQSPNAGADWGGLSTFDKAEALRLGVSLALAEHIRVSQALDLLFDALAERIASADVSASPDR